MAVGVHSHDGPGQRRQPQVARVLVSAGVGRAHARSSSAGRWWPQGFDLLQIRDPKPRAIARAPFEDRIVHTAVARLLEPVSLALCRLGIWSAAPRRQPTARHPARPALCASGTACIAPDVRAHFSPASTLTGRSRWSPGGSGSTAFAEVLARILDSGRGLADLHGLRPWLGLAPDYPPPRPGPPLPSATPAVPHPHVLQPRPPSSATSRCPATCASRDDPLPSATDARRPARRWQPSQTGCGREGLRLPGTPRRASSPVPAISTFWAPASGGTGLCQLKTRGVARALPPAGGWRRATWKGTPTDCGASNAASVRHPLGRAAAVVGRLLAAGRSSCSAAAGGCAGSGDRLSGVTRRVGFERCAAGAARGVGCRQPQPRGDPQPKSLKVPASTGWWEARRKAHVDVPVRGPDPAPKGGTRVRGREVPRAAAEDPHRRGVRGGRRNCRRVVDETSVSSRSSGNKDVHPGRPAPLPDIAVYIEQVKGVACFLAHRPRMPAAVAAVPASLIEGLRSVSGPIITLGARATGVLPLDVGRQATATPVVAQGRYPGREGSGLPPGHVVGRVGVLVGCWDAIAERGEVPAFDSCFGVFDSPSRSAS